MYGIHKGLSISNEVALVLVKEVKSWAKKNGATHFSHWVCPSPDLALVENRFDIEDIEIESFIRKPQQIRSLVQPKVEEGYLAWDTTFPPFLIQNVDSEIILYLPSLLYSSENQSLDRKIPFLRSSEKLEEEIQRLFKFCRLGEGKDAFRTGFRFECRLVDTMNIFRALDEKRITDFLSLLEETASLYGIVLDTQILDIGSSFCGISAKSEKGPLFFQHMLLFQDLFEQLSKENNIVISPEEMTFGVQKDFNVRFLWQWLDSNEKNILQKEEGGIVVLILATAVLHMVNEHKNLYQCLIANPIDETCYEGLANRRSFLSVDLGAYLGATIKELVRNSRGIKDSDIDLTSIAANISRMSSGKGQAFCELSADGFSFQSFSSISSSTFVLTVLQATFADSLHLILDEVSDIAESQVDIKKLSSLFLVLKKRWLEADSVSEINVKTEVDFRPDFFSYFLDPKTLRAFQNVLSEEELSVWQKLHYKSYAKRMKQWIQRTLDLCKEQIIPQITALSKEDVGSGFSAEVEKFRNDIAYIEKILLQSQDLGEEIQCKLFYEIGAPAMASIWQRIQESKIGAHNTKNGR